MLKHIKIIMPRVVLLLIVVAVYANTLGHGFVWDDRIFLVHRSDAYKHFDVYKMLFTLSTNGLEYLPVRDLSYALDFALWGSNPSGFHVTNVMLFSLNIIVIYIFTVKLLQLFQISYCTDLADNSLVVGFFTAALFAVHPLHGEVVNFVTMRNSLLCGVFFFSTCHLYLRYLTCNSIPNWWYAGASICFVLTVFSKATGIILPLILVMITFTFRRPKQLSGWLPLFPFLFCSCGAFFLFKHVASLSHIIEPASVKAASVQILEKIAVSIQIPFFYLYKIFIPANYSVDYDNTLFRSDPTDYRVVGALLLIVVITAISWKMRRRMPYFAFCSMWYLVTLIPVLHFFQTNPVVADRYAFLPSYPVFLLLVLSLRNIHNSFKVIVVVLFVLAGVSIMRNRVWKSDRSLWEYTVQTAPHSAVAHINLARLLFIDENECEKGLVYAKKAQTLNPSDTNYDVFQGVLSLRGNDPQRAIIDFSRALEKNSEHMESLVNLATAYEMLGDLANAALYLRRAVNSTEPDAPGDLRETAREMLQELTAEKTGIYDSRY